MVRRSADARKNESVPPGREDEIGDRALLLDGRKVDRSKPRLRLRLEERANAEEQAADGLGGEQHLTHLTGDRQKVGGLSWVSRERRSEKKHGTNYDAQRRVQTDAMGSRKDGNEDSLKGTGRMPHKSRKKTRRPGVGALHGENLKSVVKKTVKAPGKSE